jgi:glycerol 2-dehydrogenase (NADP+)
LLVARGIIVIPKSTKPSRIEENLRTITLDDEDLNLLLNLHKKKGITRFVYPPFGVDLGFPDKAEYHSGSK